MLRFALGAALFCAATPAAAMQDQDEDADASAQPTAAEIAAKPPAPPAAADGAQENSGAARPKFWFQVAVAPEIVSDSPFSSESTDSTDVTWTLGMDLALSRNVNFTLTLGPSATVDSDADAAESSKFNVVAEVTTGASVLGGLAPSFRYQFSQRYESFFTQPDGQEHIFDAALNHQFKFRGGRIDVALGPRRFESTLAGSDYSSIRLQSKLTIPVVEETIDLTFNANAERRHYDDINATIGRPRRDWRMEAIAGVNFAKAINAHLETPDLFRNFILGVRWIGIDSNVEDSDDSTFKFTPSVSIRIAF